MWIMKMRESEREQWEDREGGEREVKKNEQREREREREMEREGQEERDGKKSGSSQLEIG